MSYKIKFLMQDKKTGEKFTLVMLLKGSKRHSHIVKAVRKANKGARIVSYTVEG